MARKFEMKWLVLSAFEANAAALGFFGGKMRYAVVDPAKKKGSLYALFAKCTDKALAKQANALESRKLKLTTLVQLRLKALGDTQTKTKRMSQKAFNERNFAAGSLWC